MASLVIHHANDFWDAISPEKKAPGEEKETEKKNAKDTGREKDKGGEGTKKAGGNSNSGSSSGGGDSDDLPPDCVELTEAEAIDLQSGKINRADLLAGKKKAQ
jgi:hypothetical protein